jgi:peptidoglycan hydrolase-like protein with peptidoglycan-binding domain
VVDMKGQDVKGLQKILIGASHLPPPPDGVFGKRTLEAVKRFQAQLGVKADGVVGAKTHAAIARLLAFLAATQH